MKCPYRQLKTKTKVADYQTISDNEFKECLYGECPYYQPEDKDTWLKFNEGCWKVRTEVRE